MRRSTALNLLSLMVIVAFLVAFSLACTERETGTDAGEETAGETATDEEMAGEATEASEPVTAELSELNDSGVSGTATLTPMDGQTKVTINLEGAPEGGVHPAHIHQGACDSLGGVAFPLNDIENGTSETVLDASLETIATGNHAINVHKSAEEASAYVACGAIPQM